MVTFLSVFSPRFRGGGQRRHEFLVLLAWQSVLHLAFAGVNVCLNEITKVVPNATASHEGIHTWRSGPFDFTYTRKARVVRR